ncbi:BatD family protein [Xanthomonadaceae bacterium XH05]|nr:BatD family protein [Xanthomonadaceae bacterium XH05]
MKSHAARTVACLFAIALLLCAGNAAAQVRAWLDRSGIALGESVTLNVEGNLGGEPDFSVLSNDFRIVNRSTSSQVQIINGAMARTNLWAVALEPLREGTLVIPALTIGNQQTEPLTLTVRPMPRGSAASGDDVFLEVEVDDPSPYVQQQIAFTVRLFYAVALLEGNLDEPAGDGLQIRRIGQDANFSREIAGRRYNVVERRYALTPERSGALTVRGVTFRGRLARSGQPGSFFGQGVPMVTGSDPVTLEVQPAPANAPTPWLPARELTLRDDAERLRREVRVGDALELTLVMEAKGLSAEQMPELMLPAIPGAEIYPDQETRETTESGHGVVGKRTRKFAIVPLREGRVEFPERSITWWNVQTNQVQRNTLPAFALDVLPAAGAPAALRPEGAELPSIAASAMEPVPPNVRLWQLLAAVFALAWLLTLTAWRFLPARAVARTTLDETGVRRMTAWRPELAHALARNDLSAARRALLRMQPGLCDLEAVVSRLADPEQRDAVMALERALYRGDACGDLVERLRRAFARSPVFVEDAGFRPASRDRLPPLYPGMQ